MTALMIEETLEKTYQVVKAEVLRTPAAKLMDAPEMDDAMFALHQGMYNPLLGFRQGIALARQNFKMVNWGQAPVMTLALHFWQAGQEARR